MARTRSRSVTSRGLPPFRSNPVCEVADLDGVLDRCAGHADANGCQALANEGNPLVPAKSYEPECDGFIEGRGGHFD